MGSSPEAITVFDKSIKRSGASAADVNQLEALRPPHKEATTPLSVDSAGGAPISSSVMQSPPAGALPEGISGVSESNPNIPQNDGLINIEEVKFIILISLI